MRMARVNITVPDDVLARSRDAGLNVSRVSSEALVVELERRERLDALDRYLEELDAEQGPVTDEARATAAEWADRVLGSREAPGDRGPRAA